MVWAIADAKLVSWSKGNMGIFVSDITQLRSILLVAKEWKSFIYMSLKENKLNKCPVQVKSNQCMIQYLWT